MFERARRKSRPLFWLLAILLLVWTWGCRGQKASVSPGGMFRPQIKSVVVVGFLAAMSEGETPDLVRNPITGTSLMSQPVPQDVVRLLTGRLFDMLVSDGRWRLIPPGQAKGVIESILGSDAQVGISSLKMLQEVGNSLGADAVLAGYVYRWQERIGTDFGVEQPASVAFDLSLVRPTDGAIIWRGSFDKTQRSLFENLFDVSTYIKSDGRWLTAEKLGMIGLEGLLGQMPGKPPKKEG